MNPDKSNTTESQALPSPQTEGLTPTSASSSLENAPMQAERASVSAELPQSGMPAPAVSPTNDPLIAPPASNATPSTGQIASTLSSSGPTVAEDTDLIEKEWVNRAKAIVEQTKNDPNLQNKELSHFKADYIKKRFNKDIKVSES